MDLYSKRDRGKETMKKISLRKKLITIFVLTSTIPIILLSLFMLYNTSVTLKKNTEVLMQTNLKQIDDNMQIWLDSYEDVLYQLYTNDDLVGWADKLNKNQDVPVTISQLRRFMRGLLNTKDYIRSITIITESGKLITYDQLTPATYENSWIENFSLSQSGLYAEVSADSRTHIYPTEYGTRFASEDYYLFHLAHRIIDYRDLKKNNGIVILSLDESLLESILKTDIQGNTSTNFLVDQNGRIISCNVKKYMGERLYEEITVPKEKTEAYRKFVEESEYFGNDYISCYSYHDEELGWDIVNVTDQSVFMEELLGKVFVILSVCVILLLVTLLLIWELSGQLVDSVNQVVLFMKKVEERNLTVRVPVDKKMSMEIETIALQFNGTLQKLEYAVQEQLKAEIKALEAQINPHFLYNTLDTINWMAIDKDEFDISNAINSLANILRYAIANSAGIVTVREETDWLKKYIYLQQFRLKNKFVCRIHVPPDAMNCRIHKLLLQPFVENAIIHGFQGEQNQYVLDVSMEKEEEYLKVIIQDNGKGMEDEVAERVNKGQPVNTEDKQHIGLDNAITRLRMYYNGREQIWVNSVLGQGTEITLLLPLENI